jgi:hypothetical protein
MSEKSGQFASNPPQMKAIFERVRAYGLLRYDHG